MDKEKSKKSIFENPLLSTKVKSANVKTPELLFGYFIGPFGALLASGIFASFLSYYWTHVLFYDEATGAVSGSAQSFITWLPLISAILIVAGNLIVGQLIERTRTRAGKARPFILLASVLLALTCIIMFVIPVGSSNVVKMVLTAISYNLYYAVAYPLYNTANSTLTPVSTRNGKQRSLLASATNIAHLAVMGAGSMVFPLLLGIFVTSDTSLGSAHTFWLVMFIAIAVITFVCTVLQYYFTRERVTEESFKEGADVKAVKADKPSLGKQFKAVASEKFWWMIIIFYLVFQVCGTIKNQSMVYFCEMVVDNSFWGASLDASTAAGMTQTLLAVLGAIPMAIAVLVVWPLSNKIGKGKLTLIGLIIGVVGGIIAGIWYDNVIAVAIGVALKCLGSSPAAYLVLAMIADVLDHIEAKFGFRCDGLTMSIYSSIMAASAPISMAIVNSICSNSTAVMISYIWVETAAYAVCAIIMLVFGVEKYVKADHESILAKQKAETIAAGEEWIEPEERLRREEEASNAEAEEARKAELKARCEKKGLSYEEEEAKYQAKQEEKRKAAEAKKAKKGKK